MKAYLDSWRQTLRQSTPFDWMLVFAVIANAVYWIGAPW